MSENEATMSALSLDNVSMASESTAAEQTIRLVARLMEGGFNTDEEECTTLDSLTKLLTNVTTGALPDETEPRPLHERIDSAGFVSIEHISLFNVCIHEERNPKLLLPAVLSRQAALLNLSYFYF
jgi:hypothetical protein